MLRYYSFNHCTSRNLTADFSPLSLSLRHELVCIATPGEARYSGLPRPQGTGVRASCHRTVRRVTSTVTNSRETEREREREIY